MSSRDTTDAPNAQQMTDSPRHSHSTSVSESSRVADRWSTHHAETDTFSPRVYWLAVPQVMRRFQARATGGHAAHWSDYCVRHFLKGRTPVARMCSLGCGTGALERHIAALHAFERCDAFDLAPGALEVAQRQADAAGITNIVYAVGDLNTLELPADTYDAIWFNHSLHHVRHLEALCDRVSRALTPGGMVFINEYVGANRFDFPPRQKDAIRAAFALLPERYRRCFAMDGLPVLSEPLLPDPRAVEAADPSESVRSADILRVVRDRFDIVAHHDIGGTLLQFLLHGICGNFRSDDPESVAVLEMLFRIEDTLVDTGDLPSDFVTVVARQRSTG